MELNLRPAEECTFDAVLIRAKAEFVQQEASEHGKAAENTMLFVDFADASA